METTCTIEFMRLAEPPSPQIKQPSGFHVACSRSSSLSWKASRAYGCGRGGIDFAGSALVFPGRDGAPFSNKAFNVRLKLACERARVPVISAHPLRDTAATLLLNERGANLLDVQALLGHKSIATTARYTHVDSQRLRTFVGNLRLHS
jgi:site-specific recombinase XerD